MPRVAWVVVVAVLAVLGVSGTAQAAVATAVTGWPTTTLTGAVGYPVSTPVTVKTGTGYVARAVQLQRRPSTSTTWTTIGNLTTSTAGTATVGYTLPSVGTWYYRLYVVPSTTAAGTLTAARTVVSITGQATAVTGWPTTTLTGAVGSPVSTWRIVLTR